MPSLLGLRAPTMTDPGVGGGKRDLLMAIRPHNHPGGSSPHVHAPREAARLYGLRSPGLRAAHTAAGASGLSPSNMLALLGFAPSVTSIAQRTASTTLRNSMRLPSPVLLTMRP